jgi:hypothetical protein
MLAACDSPLAYLSRDASAQPNNCNPFRKRKMLNPFSQPQLIKTEVFMSMPAKFRKKSRTSWSDPNRQGAESRVLSGGALVRSRREPVVRRHSVRTRASG